MQIFSKRYCWTEGMGCETTSKINMQRWRFFYGRMAIQKRLKQSNLIAPPSRIEDGGNSIAKKISELSGTFSKIMKE